MAMKKNSAKRSRSKAKKNQPAVRQLRYEITNSGTPGNETSHFIDLARDLSLMNRRLYRQGRDYHVKRITIVSSNTPNGENRVSFSTAGDSWVTREAWKRGFDVFTRMRSDASHNLAGNIEGTWADFKVYLSNDMQTSTLPVPRPLDNGGNAVLLNEWYYSDLVTPEDGGTASDAFKVGLLGNHSGSAGARSYVGLIKSYGESRSTVNPDDPNVPAVASDDPLVNVFDYGASMDTVIDSMELSNDNPPYDIANYPGDDGNVPKPQIVQDTTIVDGKATVGGFNAIAGLIEVECKSPIANDVYSILVELAPGSYRGIKADVI